MPQEPLRNTNKELAFYIKEFYSYAKKNIKESFDKVFVTCVNDKQISENFFNQTANYDPSLKKITLYICNRHPKDIVRSFAHELIHHVQNCRGEFETLSSLKEDYVQTDSHLRKMEEEAYLRGNMLFRDWTDFKKKSIKK